MTNPSFTFEEMEFIKALLEQRLENAPGYHERRMCTVLLQRIEQAVIV